MALLKGKLFAGALFVGALFTGVPGEAPVVETAQPGAGVRFIPVQVGKSSAESQRVRVKYGRVTAVGEDWTVPVVAAVPTERVRVLSPPAFADGAASAAVLPAQVRAAGAGVSVHAAAKVSVPTASSSIQCRGSVVRAGATSYVASARVLPCGGSGSARGILNPSEEEIVLMYLRHRNSERLRTAAKSGRVARI